MLASILSLTLASCVWGQDTAQLEGRDEVQPPPAAIGETKTLQTQLRELQVDAGRLKEWLKTNSLQALLEMADAAAPARNPPAFLLPAFRQQTLRQQTLTSPAVVRCLAERGELKMLLDEIRKSGDWPWRQQFVLAVTISSGVDGPLLKLPGVAELVLQTVREEPIKALRDGMATQLVRTTSSRQTLLWSGHEAALRELFAAAPQPVDSTLANELLYSPSGVLGLRIDRQEYDEAERLLRADLGSELAKVRWISYLTVRGRLAEEIERLEKNPDPKSSPGDVLMLMRLHRANGDVESAVKYARRFETSQPLHFLWSEARRWKEAAEHLRAKKPKGAATPAAMEALSYLAAYQRLAGDRHGSLATLQAMRDATRDAKASTVLLNVAKTMLLNHQTDDGLAMLEKADPAIAFLMHRFRLDFDNALRLVGAQPGATFDREWLAKLPAPPFKKSAPMPWLTPSRNQLALEVVQTLRMLGRDDDAAKAMGLLEAEFERNAGARAGDGAGKGNAGNTSAADSAVNLAADILRFEGPRRAASMIDKSLSAEQVKVLSHNLMPLRGVVGPSTEGWLRAGNPNASQAELWAEEFRLRTGQFSSSELDRLLAEGERQAEANAAAASSSTAIASTLSGQRQTLGRLCLLYGRPEQARAHLEKADPTHPGVLSALVEALRAEKAWPEAARAAEADYERDRERLLSLYLAGDAWQRAGDKPRGERLKRQASLLAFGNRTRHSLAADLARLGLTEDAVRQHEILQRVETIDSWARHDSLRQVADLTVDADPLRSAALREECALHVSSWTSFLSKPVDLLRDPPPYLAAQARADVEAGRFEQAAERIERALEVNPTASIVAERLVPALEAAGKKDDADRLFARLYDRLEGIAKAHPRCAVVHNDLAWMSARCRRRLDDALRHAERAVELSPTAPHLDTLAEAYFQRGAREAAIRESRRALELEPRSEHHRRRAEHFEKAPK